MADAARYFPTNHREGKRIFLQGFAENGAEFWKNFADDDILAETKKDAMIASLHVKL